MLENKKVSTHAKYNFNKEELVEIAANLATKCQDKQSIEDEKKSVVSNYKAQLDGVDAEINKLSTNYRLGFEFRFMECILSFDDKKKIRTYRRCDNNEIVKTEPMTTEDFQEMLPL